MSDFTPSLGVPYRQPAQEHTLGGPSSSRPTCTHILHLLSSLIHRFYTEKNFVQLLHQHFSFENLSYCSKMCPSLPLSRIKNTRYLSLSMETKHTPSNGKHTPSNGTCTHETSWRHNRTTYASNLPRRRHSMNLFTSLSLDHFFMTSRQPIQPTNARSWRHTFSGTLRTRMFTARMLSSLLPSDTCYVHFTCCICTFFCGCGYG